MPLFQRYLGIDYSGAETPTSSLKGIRVYSATPAQEPAEVAPAPGVQKYWTRRGLAEWLVGELQNAPATLVGIDHAFSFPLRYFQSHRIPPDWPAFLDDFQRHWPTDEKNTYVDFVRDGVCGHGVARTGSPRWRRLTDVRCRAKSVFHFGVPGSVAKATHAGLPWLRHLRNEFGPRLHFWPFDGWEPPPGRSVIAEVYPALWNRVFPSSGRDVHQHDAWSVARWMQLTDGSDRLRDCFAPDLPPGERSVAGVEGWVLGLL